jgi:ribosomal protein S18 acetylase RimI-like enzyme
VEVRTVDASDVELCERLGAIVVRSYTSLPGHVPEPDYEVELADVESRAAMPDTVVWAAVEGGTPLGCVTYVVSTASPMAELVEEGEAAFRMLGVDPDAQGRGAGRVLVEACLARARADGRRAVVLHTTPWMTAAHRLYESFGFRRDESRDWSPVPGIALLAYRLDLGVGATA